MLQDSTKKLAFSIVESLNLSINKSNRTLKEGDLYLIEDCCDAFGSKYDNSQEAKELIATGGGFSITTSNEFSTQLRSLLNNQEHYINTSFAATNVIHNNLGSSTRVVRGIIRD